MEVRTDLQLCLRFSVSLSRIPYFRDGFVVYAEVSASGRTMDRVRVHDNPPTDSQRWLRWLGKWNSDAGEQIAYLDRSVAIEAGLVPAEGFGDDFWHGCGAGGLPRAVPVNDSRDHS